VWTLRICYDIYILLCNRAAGRCVSARATYLLLTASKRRGRGREGVVEEGVAPRKRRAPPPPTIPLSARAVRYTTRKTRCHQSGFRPLCHDISARLYRHTHDTKNSVESSDQTLSCPTCTHCTRTSLTCREPWRRAPGTALLLLTAHNPCACTDHGNPTPTRRPPLCADPSPPAWVTPLRPKVLWARPAGHRRSWFRL
jgi:hypothetical protein